MRNSRTPKWLNIVVTAFSRDNAHDSSRNSSIWPE